MGTGERIVTTTCGHNCGGRCLLRVHVRDGRVVRITTDDREEKDGYVQLRACLRGRSYRERLYHPERLLYPLKRTGKRGEGKFTRISWDEATDIIAGQLARITGRFGPESRYLHYGTGISGVMNEGDFFRRLLCVYGGGFLGYYNSYSTACTKTATEYTFGTHLSGGSPENWLYSRLIILWGHNPAETSFGTNTMYYLKKAKENGARIVVVDPRYSDTAAALADRWIPLLPTTDNALMDAMTYVMVTEKLYDEEFVEKYCLGFHAGQMPAGVPENLSLCDYILGKTDGIPKTPKWAQNITRVPAEEIRRLAYEYATEKPAALIQGWGPQRHAYGEQPARGATVLAAITGNVGITGGWASGLGLYSPLAVAKIPFNNPVKIQIPVFAWTQAVARPETLGKKEGLRNAERLTSGIKFLACLAGNSLINQHSDIYRTGKILEDESACEFILVSDEFMTSSACYADLLLPSTNFLEREDIAMSWGNQDYVIFQNKAVEPPAECRTGYDWLLEVAKKLGVAHSFSGGRTYEDWLRYVVAETKKRHPDFPDLDELRSRGLYREKSGEPWIAFKEQIGDFANHPFPTPSGRIEIFSKRLYEMNNPEIPAIPKYIPCWEGPQDPLRKEYPLQLFGWHSKRSTHSTMANLEAIEEISPMELWINPADAKERGVEDGDLVRVFNRRGELKVRARVTVRIIPGVVALPQGAWYKPTRCAKEPNPSINLVTRDKLTPLAKGNPQHTNLVEVKKFETGELLS